MRELLLLAMTRAAIETYAGRLEHALPALRERVERAAALSGRSAADVRLVAVTKAHPLDAVEAALAAGLADLGENRIEELEDKVGELGRDVATWHMIGHLQSRKARRALDVADLIHSVDTPKLGEKLSRAAVETNRMARVLVQVNTSGEASKSGFSGATAAERIVELAELPGIEVGGLMTMAPFVDDEAVLSHTFGELRRLGERLREASNAVGPELSMGMTNDLEVAIREGSTMVRIGTALFGERVR